MATQEATERLEHVAAREEIRLKEYLDDIANHANGDHDNKFSTRIYCCNSSRSLYCPECYKVLIPQQEWPQCFRKDPKLSLPFTMDIVLGWKERRTSSSGIHMMAISNMMEATAQSTDSNGVDWWRSIRLFDINRGDTLPSHVGEQDATFVLFPQKGRSVPISQVAHKLKRLVVLDVKWTRTGIVQLDPSLAKLQTVHLDHTPKQSHFWRWHQRGEGMLSTMEAIYFAAIEVAASKGWSEEDRQRLMHLMWLFALQRRAIIRQQGTKRSGGNSSPLPFSAEGKDKQRNDRIRNRKDVKAQEIATEAVAKVSLA